MNPRIIQLHAAIQEFEMMGCWGMAQALREILQGLVDG